MTNLSNWAKPANDHDIAQLESLLQAALLPVPPRGSYQTDLRHRLGNYDAPAIEFRTSSSYSMLLWMLAGLLFVMLLLVVGIKAFVALGGWGAISALRRHPDARL